MNGNGNGNNNNNNNNTSMDHPFGNSMSSSTSSSSSSSGNRPSSSSYTHPYGSSSASQVASISNINNPQNTSVELSSPVQMMDQNGIKATGKGDNMVKKEGNDWVVVFNPQVQTNINVSLAHNIEQQSVVCCVRFSADGKYLATGSNKQAQIYDVDTGKKVMAFPAITSVSSTDVKKSSNHVAQSETDDMSDTEDEEPAAACR